MANIAKYSCNPIGLLVMGRPENGIENSRLIHEKKFSEEGAKTCLKFLLEEAAPKIDNRHKYYYQMTVRETLNELFDLSHDKTNPIWEQNITRVDFSALDDLKGIEMEVQSRISREKFMQASKSYLEGIIRAKQNADPRLGISLNFLQFIHAAEVVRMCNSNGLFSESHDWLEFSLCDTLEAGQRHTEPDRFVDFFESKEGLIVRNRTNELLFWMGELFYYSRKRGGLKELAERIFQQYWKLTAHYSKEFPFYDESIKARALCHTLAWAIINNKGEQKELALALVDMYENAKNRESKKLAVVQLSGGGFQFTVRSAAEWAKAGLDDYGDQLYAHERLQLLNNYCLDDVKKISKHLPEIREAIKNYMQHIGGERLILKYEKARIFSVLFGLILKCLENGLLGEATLLISDFKEVDEASRLDANHLFVIVNYSPSVAYASDKGFIKGDKTSVKRYCELVSQSNLFLGTTVTMNDIPEFVLVKPKQMGIPDDEEGANFESAIHNHYSLELLTELDLSKSESMIILPGVQHPIQPLMIKELGTSLPIAVSFEKPLRQRKVKKVLLWCFGTRTSDPERELVEKIFKQWGIEVDAVDIENLSKVDFIDKYSSSEYDVVWLATHGDYKHFSPHKSQIEILNEVHIEVEEIFETEPKVDGQRLLFLNICDGATAASYNALYDIGIGASLCNKNQAVLSHIWPIEVDYALVFALLYAHYLAKGDSFFIAHQNTVKTILAGKDAMKETLKEYEFINEELVNKLDAEVPKNIYYWGSSAYYQ